MNRFLLLIFSLFIAVQIKSQTNKTRDQYLILNLSQIKESMNFGFVFSGLQIQYGRTWRWQKNVNHWELETQLGASYLKQKGIGLDFHISPISFNYLIAASNQFWIGPCLMSDYNYEFYPDMQVGHDFWFSHYSAGIVMFFQKPFQKRILSFKLNSSIVGFTSRTPNDVNALFFYDGFKYAIKDLHKGLKFGSFNRYNVFHLETSLRSIHNKRTNLSFITDYMVYHLTPVWTRLNYGLKIIIRSKS